MSLPGSERYRREETESDRTRTRTQAMIERANTIPIQRVLRDHFGTEVPDELDRSWKTRCPFGFEHPDGGIEAGMRVYPTNSAFCFVMHGFLSSVKLVQIQKDCGAAHAARSLARQYGLEDDEPYWKRMERLVAEAESVYRTGKAQNAADAMQVALHRLPGYDSRQYDEPILTTLEARLEKLDEVVRHREPGVIRAWLDETVECVRRRLEDTT